MQASQIETHGVVGIVEGPVGICARFMVRIWSNAWRLLLLAWLLAIATGSSRTFAQTPPPPCQPGGGYACTSLRIGPWYFTPHTETISWALCPGITTLSEGAAVAYTSNCYDIATHYCTWNILPHDPWDTAGPQTCSGELCSNFLYNWVSVPTYYDNDTPVPCTHGPTSTSFGFHRNRSVSCPDGYGATSDGGTPPKYYCARLLSNPDNRKGCASGNCPTFAGNPINVGNGNKLEIETDYSGQGPYPLIFTRTYNGLDTPVTAAYTSEVRPIGAHWRHSYDRRIELYTSTYFSTVTALRPDGRQLLFNLSGTAWVPDADIVDRLVRLTDGGGTPTGWTYTSTDDEVEEYDANGRLISITHRTGLKQTLGYDGNGRLASVTDPFGRQLQFTYDALNRIATMTAPNGQYQYAYVARNVAGDVLGNLDTVTYPDTKVRKYHYNESTYTSGYNLPSALTGITDENNSRFAIFKYDLYNRATSTEHAGGVNKFTLYYGGSSWTSVTDPLNGAHSYGLQTILSLRRNTSVDGARCSSCGDAAAKTYDANGNISSKTDFNNRRGCYVYDLSRNLETVRGEGLTAGSCPANLTSWNPAAGTVERKITTEWNATWRLPYRIAEPKRIITFQYDGSGNLVSKSIQATTDASGGQGFSASPTGSPRTWTYTHTYHATIAGFITQTTVNGPRTDVTDTTTYSYDTTTGSIASATNALGHVTTFGNYDADGRPRQITDPNGQVTALTYDPRGRLTARNVGGETTAYEYDGVGQLKKVTSPDASYISYTYDAAHRLTQIQDNLGSKIVYTLDAMGNRTKDEVFDPALTLKQKRQREYNNLDRLTKDIGGANPATEITQYGYDNQGNLTTVTDPLGKITTNEYDALSRLKKMIDPAASGSGQGGNTQYAYDGLDQLTQVTDPRALTTTYTLDGLGNLTQQVSPDTGTNASGADAAGNLTSTTDARGVTAALTYDALSRLTQAVYTPPGGSGITAVTLTYTYDQGSNGKGKLTGFTDPSGSTSYTWNQKGRLATEVRTISGVQYTTQYAYDSNGRLNKVTYPSGRTVDYTLNALGRIQQIDTTYSSLTQAIVSSVAYHPFGSVKSFTFGNATTYSRSFDLNGRISTYNLSTLSRTLGFDADSRITGYTHNQSAYDQTFGYDNLDRLTGWSNNSSSQSYGYDLTSNRTSLTISGNNYPYTIASTSNRLTQTNGPGGVRTFGFDAAGNIISGGGQTFSYDARGRIESGSTLLGAATYMVNALGQRVAKTVGGVTTHFHYDAQGTLIAESSGTGQVGREYVWLNATPVTAIDSNTVYFIHPDHLDTPRVVTNQANTIIWRWDSDPFGVSPALQDPDGNGQDFVLNLRLPGQYFDKESNYHYNYFRDYDPQTGRYAQSDPIGLGGGVNTYTYVLGNPLRFFDPLGLWSCNGGDVDPTGVPGTAAEGAAAWAQYQYEKDNRDYTKDAANTSCGGAGAWKCNCFVKDAYQKGGGTPDKNLPKHYQNGKAGPYFAQANDWGNPSINKGIVGPGDGSVGNIVVWPKEGDNGHVGIVGCDGKVYSARRDGIDRSNRDFGYNRFYYWWEDREQIYRTCCGANR